MAVSSNNPEDPITDINLTPLVDVCLVLVIIFMVTAPLLSEPAFKVNLPEARTQEGEEKEKITVSLADSGKYAVNEQVFTDKGKFFSALERTVKASASKLVVIKADREAGYGVLTDTMQRAKEAGAASINIATEQKKK
ncbi:MAG: biopolymer transporter ExbD [Elusimicrobia bacterium]|nr:biopolymer transporter ExbD [Elusimicrobiota bacterium]